MPVTVTTRATKGSKLSYTELDSNLTNLQDAVNIAKNEVLTVASTANLGVQRTVLANATGGNIDLSLPDPTVNTDVVYIIKKIDASVNTVTLLPDASETIDGAASVVLTTQYETVKVVCDGVNWFVI